MLNVWKCITRLNLAPFNLVYISTERYERKKTTYETEKHRLSDEIIALKS